MLSGTGTTPARIAPRNTDRKIDGVEHDHRHALFAADAETAQQIGDAAALLLQIAIGQFGNGIGEREFAAAAFIDIAIEQPGHRVVGLLMRAQPRVHDVLPNFKNYNS